MTRQQLFFLVLFVAVALLNVLGQVLQRRAKRAREAQEREPTVPAAPTPPPRPVERPAPRLVRRRDLPAAIPEPERAHPGRHARRVRARLGPHDLRRAVVLSVVLAPCPGAQTPDR